MDSIQNMMLAPSPVVFAVAYGIGAPGVAELSSLLLLLLVVVVAVLLWLWLLLLLPLLMLVVLSM